YRSSDMNVHFAGPNQGADFGSFQGKLLADGTIGYVDITIKNGHCDRFTLFKKAADAQDKSANPPSFNAQGLDYEHFVRLLFEGRFAAINVSADQPMFNDLFGSYLYSYARQC